MSLGVTVRASKENWIRSFAFFGSVVLGTFRASIMSLFAGFSDMVVSEGLTLSAALRLFEELSHTVFLVHNVIAFLDKQICAVRICDTEEKVRGTLSPPSPVNWHYPSVRGD